MLFVSSCTRLLTVFVISGMMFGFPNHLHAQLHSHADSLEGSNGPGRNWWNVLHYDIDVTFQPGDSSIVGSNRITYKIISAGEEMQIDLMPPLVLDSIVQNGNKLAMRKDGSAYFVQMQTVQLNNIGSMTAYYHGHPVAAKLPPWNGGVVWKKDADGQPWISVACEGMAARVWLPNKDYSGDEPDSMKICIHADPPLTAVSNGRQINIGKGRGDHSFTWKVTNPINHYNIIPYIGNYVNFNDTLNGRGGVLTLDYWVHPSKLDQAKKQFGQVKGMLRCFEDWFGPYPFYADGYKLVQAPYLGMEHQSGIAYGNGFRNGYLGRDLSNTGWGLKWDFIIVHESGHEWFGNNITAADVADNWIHESFTSYSENLYVEWFYGKEAGADYVIGTRASVQNDVPAIAAYSVNAEGSTDMYYKGANMLHTIRQFVDNDSLWKAMFREMNRQFYHSTVTSAQIENFMSSFLNMNLKPVFDQYLRTTTLPVLEYRKKGGKLEFRWAGSVEGFDMPVKIIGKKSTVILKPAAEWQKVKYPGKNWKIDRNYYVLSRQR